NDFGGAAAPLACAASAIELPKPKEKKAAGCGHEVGTERLQHNTEAGAPGGGGDAKRQTTRHARDGAGHRRQGSEVPSLLHLLGGRGGVDLEGADETAAVKTGAPGFVEAIATIRILQRVSRHGMLHLVERRIV